MTLFDYKKSRLQEIPNFGETIELAKHKRPRESILRFSLALLFFTEISDYSQSKSFFVLLYPINRKFKKLLRLLQRKHHLWFEQCSTPLQDLAQLLSFST